ncbi:uncharacterized protein Tco025E_01646 [Trypanosoma conorhini]|uniref:Uncharacterized protein n=1 Tax=Trypanosoma conorhini TaxID=83891 RepID=A0A3R7NRX0_9TRYP|nr:uncharacterized protein Tco025E_01646 [Trypanosoma conorhini]RNF26117.1 hypothetical protein Tco025E_01646 [Trypanosoma conorhini]
MLRVVSLGSLVSDPRFFRQHTHGLMPYPVGYTVERGVFVGAGGGAAGERRKLLLPGDPGADAHVADVYFTATIKKGPGGAPLFEVTRSDCPDVVHSGDNPSTPWRKAFEAAEREFPQNAAELAKERRDAQGGVAVRGQKLFGLTFDGVLERLRTLPGASVLSQGGKRSPRPSARGGKKSREGSVATTRAAAAAATEKPAKRPRARTSLEGSQQSAAPTDASAPLKRRRVAKKEVSQNDDKNSATLVDDEDVPFSVSLAGRLGGVRAPCPECGLMTMFCPMTGQAHAVGVSQGNSGGAAHGEAAGKARRTPRKKEVSPAASAAASKRAGRKRPRDTDAADGTKAASGKSSERGGVGRQAARRKATTSETPSASAAATPTGSQRKRQVQLKLQVAESQAESCDPDDMPLTVRLAKSIVAVSTATAAAAATAVPPSLPVSPLPPPPLWRPPLEAAESQKAVQVLQRLIRAEEVIHVPFAALLQIPLLAAPKPRPVKKKSEPVTATEQPGADAEGVADKDADAGAAAAKMKTANNPLEGKDRHPLDVVDVAVSVAGKRYVKFMQLYTSERTKLDLLRKADAVPAVPRTHASLRKRAAKNDEENVQPPRAPAANGGSDQVKPEPQQS